MSNLQAVLLALAEQVHIQQAVIVGSNHSYRCRCATCLQWWVAIGPEDMGDGWGFGPFTREEFVAAGGVVPPYPGEEVNEQ